MSVESALISAGILAAIGLFGLAIYADAQSSSACESKGGRIVSRSTAGVGLTSGGQAASTFGTISFCVSEDGRILE